MTSRVLFSREGVNFNPRSYSQKLTKQRVKNRDRRKPWRHPQEDAINVTQTEQPQETLVHFIENHSFIFICQHPSYLVTCHVISFFLCDFSSITKNKSFHSRTYVYRSPWIIGTDVLYKTKRHFSSPPDPYWEQNKELLPVSRNK